MKLNKYNTSNALITIIYILFILSIAFRRLNFFVDIYLIYAQLILYTILSILYAKKIQARSIFFILPLVALMIISILMQVSGLGSYINVINLVLLISATKKVQLKEKNYILLYILSIVLLLVLWIKSINVWNNFANNIADDNPNVVAQDIVLVYGIICSGLNHLKKYKRWKVLIILISTITLISIIKCNCRTALIIYIILLISLTSKNIKRIIERIYQPLLFIIVIIGIIFPFIYVSLHKNSYDIDMTMFTSKGLYTGREKIWNTAIIELKNSGVKGLMIGLGTHHQTSKGIITNFHNWYLGMIYYFGIPITLIYFSYLIYQLSNKQNLILKIMMLSVLIFGFTETSALWARSQLIIFIILLFNDAKKEKGIEKWKNRN